MKNHRNIFFVKLLAIFTAYLFIPMDEYLFIIFGLGAGLAHFFHGAYFGRNHLKDAISHARGRLALGFLFVLWMVLYFKAHFFLAFLLFLPHYSFTEAYFGIEKQILPQSSSLIVARVVLESLVYLMISLRERWILGNEALWFSLLLFSAFVYAVLLWKKRRTLPKTLAFNLLGSVILSIGLVVVNFSYLKFSDNRAAFFIVLVHGLIWFYYPLYKEQFHWTRKNSIQMSSIVATTVLIALFFLYLNRSFDLPPFKLYSIYAFFLYFHVFSSLASSKENPKLIFSFFHPTRIE